MVKLAPWNPRTDVDTFTPLRDPFFRRLFDGMNLDLEDTSHWAPVMNVYEGKKDLFVQFDIPGIDPKNLEINLQDQTLTIKGERNMPQLGEDLRELRSEQFRGRFQRMLHLPMQVDPDGVSAKADRGVMTITMPKAKQHIGRQIPIDTK